MSVITERSDKKGREDEVSLIRLSKEIIDIILEIIFVVVCSRVSLFADGTQPSD
jgi:hypothetical protein